MKPVPTEKTIDRALVASVRAAGGEAIKLATVGPYGFAGLPDRLVLFPSGRALFVEVKRPGARQTALQQRWERALGRLGFLVLLVDDLDRARKFGERYGRRR